MSSSSSYEEKAVGSKLRIGQGEILQARYGLMNHVTEEHQGWASHYFSYDELGQE